MLNFQVQKLNFFDSARPLVIYLNAATSLARMQQRPSLPHPYISVYYMLQLRRRRLHPVERGVRQPMAGRPEFPPSLFNRPLCNKFHNYFQIRGTVRDRKKASKEVI